jgi:short-subunit dehydrogenase
LPVIITPIGKINNNAMACFYNKKHLLCSNHENSVDFTSFTSTERIVNRIKYSMKNSTLTRPVAIITGASRGIGKTVAEYFARQKYTVVLVARSKEKLAALSKQLSTAFNTKSCYYAIDIADLPKVQQAVSEVKAEFKRADVLFNNAGVVNFGTSTISPDKFDEIININLKGAYNWISQIVPLMREQKKGYIFNICSRAAKFPNQGTGAYALTKVGLLGYSYALLRELISDNIKVTALCPGAVNTEMLDKFSVSNPTLALDRNKIISTSDVVKIVDCLLSLSDGVAVPEILFDNVQSPFLNIEQKFHEKGH